MSWFSEYDEQTGVYIEGRLGEACYPICGHPMLAKYSDDGELLEIIDSCPACKEVA